MKTKLCFLFLLLTVCASAQKSIQGKLTLRKTDKKDFILRNTKVILLTKNGIDSTDINADLTFSFDNIQSDSVTIYLKSPVLSPNATTTFAMKKDKPTKLKLNYAAIHRYSESDPIKQKESDERFADFVDTLSTVQFFTNLFLTVSLLIR